VPPEVIRRSGIFFGRSSPHYSTELLVHIHRVKNKNILLFKLEQKVTHKYVGIYTPDQDEEKRLALAAERANRGIRGLARSGRR